MTAKNLAYRGATGTAAFAVREVYATPVMRLWREYLQLLEDELKEELIDAESRKAVAAQILIIRRILADTDPNQALPRRTPTSGKSGTTGS